MRGGVFAETADNDLPPIEVTALLGINHDGTIACTLTADHARVDFERRNTDFEAYYQRMLALEPAEWELLLSTLMTDLPITMRLPRDFAGARKLKGRLEEAFGALEGIEMPSLLPWYPEGLAWQWNIDSLTFRGKIRGKGKECRSVPDRVSLHGMILAETELGHIVRQEAVSMVPPLLLRLESHHHVLVSAHVRLNLTRTNFLLVLYEPC